jgi:hypothetical protein
MKKKIKHKLLIKKEVITKLTSEKLKNVFGGGGTDTKANDSLWCDGDLTFPKG